MLGKQHMLLSTGTVLPFLIPLVFLESNLPLLYAIIFYIAVMIGSLTPDADCGGKSKLHYDFPYVYVAMKPIQWLTVKLFRSKKIRAKLKVEKEVKEEHRGIMHSPIGILISSFLLSLVLMGILILLNSLNGIIILIIFAGLFIGQFLHLLQDSCTKTGINWKFPFGDKLVKGKIFTGDSKDKRPLIYISILNFVPVMLIVLYAMQEMNFSLGLLYSLLVVLMSLLWLLFLKISKKGK
jgi:membrane-bound metal-dependent hydrolase YbcI (DUF457 family)